MQTQQADRIDSAAHEGASTASPIVECKDLSFAYEGNPVIEGASFSVYLHEFVSIVGPNGGGKSTLLKLMLGLLHPTRGEVRVFGKRPEEARHRIGYMPQHAHLDPQFPVNVMDVVLMGRLGNHGLRILGLYNKADREAAEEALRKMHIEEKRDVHFSALSGGQRQRVLIARALASEPDLLLLDEPAAGLDLAVEAELYELLRNFTKRLTVVVVSHDLGFVSQYVSKVVCVKQSVAVHPTSEVTGEVISDVYGGPMKMVRHDQKSLEAARNCFNS